MARGVNKAIIVGSLGADPEVKQLASGSAVANISVATNESWKDKNSGENIEKTEWHRVVVFGKLAEICGQYLRKGSQVYFEGKLQTRKWQDQSGQDRYSTEIVANEMQMLGGRSSDSNETTAHNPLQQEQPQTSQANAQRADDIPGFDEDIPF